MATPIQTSNANSVVYTNHIQHLPHDILSKVFQLAYNDDQQSVNTYAAVCRDWRDIIHDRSPNLWKELVLGSCRPAEKSEMWVKRSNGQIKCIRFKRIFGEVDVGVMVRVDEALGKSCVGKIEKVVIECPVSRIRDVWRGRMRALKVLVARQPPEKMDKTKTGFDLDLMSDDADGIEVVNLIGVEELQISRHLTVAIPPDLPETQRRYTKIRKIHIEDAFVRTPLLLKARFQVLQQFPRIESVTFHGIVGISDTYMPVPMNVSTMTLNRLTEYHDRQNLGERSFRHLNVPALTKLSLYQGGSSDGDYQVWRDLSEPGLTSALPNLKRLDIGKSFIPSLVLVDLLRNLPQLRFLNVGGCEIDDIVLAALTGDPGICKHLQAFGVSLNEKITPKAVIHFIDSRLPANNIDSQHEHAHRITWLNLDHMDAFSNDEIDELRGKVDRVSHCSTTEEENEARMRGQGEYSWEKM